jgi:hypothetical protein
MICNTVLHIKLNRERDPVKKLLTSNKRFVNIRLVTAKHIFKTNLEFHMKFNNAVQKIIAKEYTVEQLRDTFTLTAEQESALVQALANA